MVHAAQLREQAGLAENHGLREQVSALQAAWTLSPVEVADEETGCRLSIPQGINSIYTIVSGDFHEHAAARHLHGRHRERTPWRAHKGTGRWQATSSARTARSCKARKQGKRHLPGPAPSAP